jgi:hypothetical protein
MNREIHVRICQGVRVRFPCATRLMDSAGMLVKACVVEFSSDQEQDRGHGFEVSIPERVAVGGPKQQVDRQV